MPAAKPTYLDQTLPEPKVQSDPLVEHFRKLLHLLGEDPSREGLLDTPLRLSRAWREWTKGYSADPGHILKTFEDGAPQKEELVYVGGIPIYSHCEHHLAPFFGTAHVGYVPGRYIVGLSKLLRLVDLFSRRLQVQERLTNQIADALVEHVAPLGVAVVVKCRHLCMESRGVRTRPIWTFTTAYQGLLREEPHLRTEFLTLLQLGADSTPVDADNASPECATANPL